LASFGVIGGALLISWTGVTAVDPVVTILISILVAWSSWGLVRESSDVLMNTAPRGVEADTVAQAIINIDGIVDVHDVHVWSIDGNHIAASLHVRVPQERIHEGPEIVARLKPLLHERFNIEHATIEIECDDCAMPGC
ncbi:MAG TPA: cation diffusion facilitator family transporter, partial [Candidatus Baltobacteraceae bacterium]|nr:cation diffusion facilitator family transporter [Candidatus Baltobacteraceae bacterium]